MVELVDTLLSGGSAGNGVQVRVLFWALLFTGEESLSRPNRFSEVIMQGIAILGSTGSIGKQAVDVIRLHPDRFFVTALTAHKNAALLFEQVRILRPKLAALTGATAPVDVPDDLRFCEFRF